MRCLLGWKSPYLWPPSISHWFDRWASHRKSEALECFLPWVAKFRVSNSGFFWSMLFLYPWIFNSLTFCVLKVYMLVGYLEFYYYTIDNTKSKEVLFPGCARSAVRSVGWPFPPGPRHFHEQGVSACSFRCLSPAALRGAENPWGSKPQAGAPLGAGTPSVFRDKRRKW